VLDKQPRFVLVLDRSGSMASGHKMADAQHGAVYWLEFCSVDDDLLAVIWYDHAIDRILNLVQVDTVGDLTPIEDAVNALTPRGSTNIRDGLFEALDQIQSLDTRAATQVALLLTDGKHNTPSGSSAAEALPDFQNAGVRIYSLGVGTPAAVDMDTLDELADGTGGRSFAVGDDEPGQVEAAMVEINAEVRGGIITTSPASFPDAKRSPLDEWASAKKRPSLREILEALQLHVEHLRRPHPRLVVIPVMVEAKCSRASFTLIFPEAERLWLYLVDPDGRIVDMAEAGVHLRQSTAPHEFAIVDAPKAGRWLLIAVRPTSGPAFTFRAVAGGENTNLQVFGAAQTANAAGAPVRISARARWLHELSNITVTATVVSPTGEKVHITLRDGGGSRPEDGLYEGYYTPSHPGRHSGIIRIRSTGRARIAQAYHLAAHRMEKSISVRVKVPSFVREIPIYFDAGARRPVKDVEKEKGLVDKYRKERKRARKLQSATRVQASRKRGTTRPKGRVTNAMRRKPLGRSKR
jgi:hypothetical protein